MIRVVLVDDHGVVRRGLHGYLGIFDDLEVVGEATDGEQAVQLLARLDGSLAVDGGGLPDVVLMDLSMAPMDGVTATRAIRSRWPGVQVVALTSFVDEERVLEALDAGAAGYIIKDAAAEEIVLAIRAAHRGELHVDPAVARALLSARHRGADGGPFRDLTDREREVLALVAQGLSNQQIARQLVTSERTARTHVSNILQKLGLASRTQAALLAVQHGLAGPTR